MVECPGGVGRKTVIVWIADTPYVVSKRKSESRAALEAQVLANMRDTGLTPQLVKRVGQWVVQQRIYGTRLSLDLEQGNASERHARLTQASEGLIDLQALGRDSSLGQSAPAIGKRPDWFLDLAQAPLRLAETLDTPVTGYDPEAVAEMLRSDERVFVKWDARPGNALVGPNGGIVWFDWEHCGLGAPEDDLVWLFADESTPIDDLALTLALDALCRRFGLDREATEQRFLLKAILHSFQRLLLIFHEKSDGPWWAARDILERDWAGVSREHVTSVCKRASMWIERVPDLEPLVPVIRATIQTCIPD